MLEARQRQHQQKSENNNHLFNTQSSDYQSTLDDCSQQILCEFRSTVSVRERKKKQDEIHCQGVSSSGVISNSKLPEKKRTRTTRKRKLSISECTSQVSTDCLTDTFDVEKEERRNQIEQERHQEELTYLERKIQMMKRLKELEKS
jgi:hypothetical protein